MVFPTPSWEAIDFSSAVNNMKCMKHLTLQLMDSNGVYLESIRTGEGV
jgi:hypothetical protein